MVIPSLPRRVHSHCRGADACDSTFIIGIKAALFEILAALISDPALLELIPDVAAHAL
jgi:hypothetical protein